MEDASSHVACEVSFWDVAWGLSMRVRRNRIGRLIISTLEYPMRQYLRFRFSDFGIALLHD